jgi:uncharacterized protein (TIGR03083 family)
MLVEQHIAALHREGELAILAARASDWDAPVPTCPGWTVRELTHHLGRVHRWAAHIVREARETAPDEETEGTRVWGEMPPDAELESWFRAGHAALVDTLMAAPDDLACWTFLAAPSPLAFWARRQAHETAVHRADAQAAGGAVDGVDTAFAVDGIDELLLCFYARRNRARTDSPASLAVVADDAAQSWIIHFGPDGARSERGTGHADGEVRGSASDLYLMLWNRLPVDRLSVSGDAGLLDVWREKARVRWS